MRSRLALLGAAVLALYLLGAYLLAPALWRRHERAGLANRDFLTRTTAGIPGDPINVALAGTAPQLLRAMRAAGWSPADPITLRSSVEIGLSVLLDRPYRDAPVSTLLYDGRRQDFAFEKPAGGSADRRHHVRFWRIASEGGDRFLGAASFDRGVGVSHLTGQITHHIAPDIDTERDGLMQALAEAGAILGRAFIPGSGPTLTGRNGGGDLYVTDGDILVASLMDVPLRRSMPPPVADPWWMGLRRSAWSTVASIVRRFF
jgi:hypothetical protein